MPLDSAAQRQVSGKFIKKLNTSFSSLSPIMFLDMIGFRRSLMYADILFFYSGNTALHCQGTSPEQKRAVHAGHGRFHFKQT